MKTVSEFMIELPLLKVDDTVTKARKILRDEGFRELYVHNGKKRLAGYIDITDVLRVQATRSNVTVDGFVKEAAMVDPCDQVEKGARLIQKYRTDSAAVVDESSKLLGGILLSDIFPVIITRNELRGKVSEVMTGKPVTCSPDDSVQKIYSMIVDSGYSAFPVVRKNRLTGVISRRDLLREGWLRTALEQNTPVQVSDLMTKEVLTVEEDASLSRAAEIMADHDISFLPVVRDQIVTGIVDRHDVLKGIRLP
ncbi:MAG: CBS domain-containing protein [Methanoregulaceae archaeon]|nr:CBS domain-containing protein [Methanoregulaceae archaeon]